MRIRSLRLKEFKRFSDLTVQGIPDTARLVVLVGPNGSGKTSLFEGLNYYASGQARRQHYKRAYHWKSMFEAEDNWHALHRKLQVEFVEEQPNDIEGWKKAFYFRTAYRHEGEFTSSAITRLGDPLDDNRRPPHLMAVETRVSDNYQRLVGNAVSALFDYASERTNTEIRTNLIGDLRDAMGRVFGDLLLQGTGRPTEDGTFLFEKGLSTGFNYANLSGGEKAAFDLLLDFTAKRPYFDNTVFCIDEPELHMHTRLQGRLLDEMYRLLPEQCQLWIATHSMGMMRRAMDLHREQPGAVVFLDFDGHDFDRTAVLEPATVDRRTWKRVFAVALDDLGELVAPESVVFCEGRRESPGGRDATFDADVYRTIFGGSYPYTDFVPLGGAGEVLKDALLVGRIFERLFSGIRVWSLIDRDDRSEVEIRRLAREGTRVLLRRDIESYLWDEEVVHLLAEASGRPEMTASLIAAKNDLLAELSDYGKPRDDVKAISGPLYNRVKRDLGLTQCGNTAEEFCRVTLAPLVMPETHVYRELEVAIFGPAATEVE